MNDFEHHCLIKEMWLEANEEYNPDPFSEDLEQEAFAEDLEEDSVYLNLEDKSLND